MIPRPLIISAMEASVQPAMSCVAEAEAVLREMFDCDVVHLAAGEKPGPEARPATFIIAISFAQLVQMLRRFGGRFPGGGPSIAFVFDAFLSPRYQSLPSVIQPLTRYHRLLSRVEHIFTPMRELNARQSSLLDREVRYLPIGVDAMRFGSGATGARWVNVNAYGRQPPAITARLSDWFNRDRHGFVHHTDHVRIGNLTDVTRHRAMFWQMLRNSQMALAYAPEAFDPGNRFECSFVGQRWFESLAAGCVVAGRRPSAAEAAELLDWTDATIELPDDPQQALDTIIDITADKPRMAAAAARNHGLILQRHDWRHRFAALCREVCPQLLDQAEEHANAALEAGRSAYS